ncbi:MAG: sel1 repeat family protein [Deltaproteobacteria bacterium]|nr:sel1 repeat family protein [Deltaproteobacteria bacterium]
MHNRRRRRRRHPKAISIAAATLTALGALGCPNVPSDTPPTSTAQEQPTRPKPRPLDASVTLDQCLRQAQSQEPPRSKACEAIAIERLLADDAETSIELFTALCEADAPGGCYGLGSAYATGLGVRPNRERARAAFRKGCDADDGASCYRLATLTVGASRKRRRASLLDRACTLGHRPACRLLGTQEGHARGCALDDGVACRAFGLSQQSAGQPAGDALRKACALDEAGGCFWSARTAERDKAREEEEGDGEGEGEEQGQRQGDDAKTTTSVMAYYDHRACELGSGDGCSRLAQAYLTGTGVPKNPTRAVELWHNACYKGLQDACWQLGDVYENGKEVDIDVEYAAKIYRYACHFGSSEGCKDAERLEAQLAPASPDDDNE